MSLLQELRADVEKELLAQSGLYNPEDIKTNTRIVDDIRKTIADMSNNVAPKPSHIAEVVIAANENIQMRDFLMGLSAEPLNINDIFDYLLLVGSAAVAEKAVPIATVFAAYLYERDKEEAKKTISEVLQVKPNYSLALLLARVFAENVDSSMFKQMASELHTEVLKNIYDKETDDNSNNSAE